MSLRLATLALLTARPMTGYQLVKYFDRNVGLLWAAPHSQIYPELQRMEADGLIEAEALPRGQKATKRRYSVTSTGRVKLAELINEVAPYPAERDLHRLKLAYAEFADLDQTRLQLQAHHEHWLRRERQWNHLLHQIRERSLPLLLDRLAHTAPDQHETITAFKIFAFEGQVARAHAEVEWAEKGLALLEHLRATRE